MILPVLVFLIVEGAFSAEKLLLCSTSTPLISLTNQHQKQIETRLSQKRQKIRKKTRTSKKKERYY